MSVSVVYHTKLTLTNTFYFHLTGLDCLSLLESLSLAHNLLTSEALSCGILSHLKKLKKLDLSRNALIHIPEYICSLTR